MVRSPLTAARATFALKAGEWFRRGRLLMVSPVHGDYRRYQAEIPLIALSKFPRPALHSAINDEGCCSIARGFGDLRLRATRWFCSPYAPVFNLLFTKLKYPLARFSPAAS